MVVTGRRCFLLFWAITALAVLGQSEVEPTTDAPPEASAPEQPDSAAEAEATTEAPAEPSAPEQPEEPASAGDLQEQSLQALKVLADQLCRTISRPDLQWVNAIIAIVFGSVALYDGAQTFKYLVVVAAGVVVFYVALGEMQWIGWGAKYLKVVAAIEVAVYLSFVTYRGYGPNVEMQDERWLPPERPQSVEFIRQHSAERSKKGNSKKRSTGATELLLGFGFATYFFHVTEACARKTPVVLNIADQPLFMTIVLTISLLLGFWIFSESHGATLVFGVIAPIIGSSLVVSTVGFLVMLSCSLLHPLYSAIPEVPPEKVPSIMDFWLMIVLPLTHGKDVGIFHFLGKDLVLENNTVQVDRILGVFFWLLFAFVGGYIQLRSVRRRKSKLTDHTAASLRLFNDSKSRAQPLLDNATQP